MNKLLIVEDDFNSRKLLRKILEYFEYEIEEAEDGEEAIEKFKQEEFLIIVMDIRMPKVDGIIAMSEIRKIEEKENRRMTPIIALTAYVNDEVKAECEKFGVKRFLEKPNNLTSLRTVFQEIINDIAEMNSMHTNQQ